MPNTNINLHRGKAAEEDEFYTQLYDIENELRHYKDHFKNKVVLCNCDDPRVSNFFHYFSYNFENLKLKKLITTCYKNDDIEIFSQNKIEEAIYLEYEGDKNKNKVPDPSEIGIKKLKGNGDFRSKECLDLLNQADIVVTNPPFSLFREYLSQLINAKKRFLILARQGALTAKENFRYFKENKVWLGRNSGEMEFEVPSHYEPRENRYRQDESGKKWRSFGNMCWLTNIDLPRRHQDLILYKTYNSKDYPKYDNFDAIDVKPYSNIPKDYPGLMGVPITFLSQHNPNQFELIGIDRPLVKELTGKQSRFKLNGKELFARIVIKNKHL